MCCKPLGATTDPQPLDGGQGQTWLAGRIVLKPAGMATEVRWRATVLAALPDTGRLRIARPVAADQQLVHGDLLGHVLYEPGQPPVIIDWALTGVRSPGPLAWQWPTRFAGTARTKRSSTLVCATELGTDAFARLAVSHAHRSRG